MRAPYSKDLRLCVLAALDQGMSKMAVHKTFGVSRSTVDDWLNLREQTGQVAAKTAYYRGRRPTLEDTAEVRAFIGAHRYNTLRQMAEAWFEAHGQRLSIMTFSTTLQRLGYTRKKRATFTESATSKRARRTPKS